MSEAVRIAYLEALKDERGFWQEKVERLERERDELKAKVHRLRDAISVAVQLRRETKE